jgi:DNA-binding NarL/FixJ family response regulator
MQHAEPTLSTCIAPAGPLQQLATIKKEDLPPNYTEKRLQERVNQLEQQHRQFSHFLEFLQENFPEVVRRILPMPSFLGLFQSQARQEKGSKKHSTKKLITPRELEVLHLLSAGLCAKEIARKLYISETTVITHKKNLKEKFGVKNTVELIKKTAPLLMLQEAD